jgi:hypothetical protein
MAYQQPSWPKLLSALLLESGRVPRLDTADDMEREAVKQVLAAVAPDPLLQGAIAKAAYPSGRWKDAIDAQLGPSTGRAVPPEDPPDGALRTIARMLVRSLQTDRRRHLSVLSFNYDTLLDMAVDEELEAVGMPKTLVHAIQKADDFERSWVETGIFIYHLHGYLADDHPNTILDADSYVPVFRGDHWSWRCMDRALTTTGTSALFIGLSLTDPSLRYVLTRWKSWHSPTTGVYLAEPPVLPDVTGCTDGRALGVMYRSIMDLYASVLDQLHLVCYHLSAYSEIQNILAAIGGRKP